MVALIRFEPDLLPFSLLNKLKIYVSSLSYKIFLLYDTVKNILALGVSGFVA